MKEYELCNTLDLRIDGRADDVIRRIGVDDILATKVSWDVRFLYLFASPRYLIPRVCFTRTQSISYTQSRNFSAFISALLNMRFYKQIMPACKNVHVLFSIEHSIVTPVKVATQNRTVFSCALLPDQTISKPLFATHTTLGFDKAAPCKDS